MAKSRPKCVLCISRFRGFQMILQKCDFWSFLPLYGQNCNFHIFAHIGGVFLHWAPHFFRLSFFEKFFKLSQIFWFTQSFGISEVLAMYEIVFKWSKSLNFRSEIDPAGPKWAILEPNCHFRNKLAQIGIFGPHFEPAAPTSDLKLRDLNNLNTIS